MQLLQDRSADSDLRCLAMALLAYRGEALEVQTVVAMKPLARGEAQLDYAHCLTLCGKDGLKELEALGRKRKPELKAEVVYGSTRWKEDGVDFALSKLRDREAHPFERVAALRGLRHRDSPFALVEALRRMEFEQGPFLYECLDLLRRAPSPDHIPYLIEVVRSEDLRGANEAVELLQKLTGYRISRDYRTWKHFYLKHRVEGTPFRATRSGEQEDTLSYMGVPLFSDRVVFVIDSSSSMQERMTRTKAETRASRAAEELVGLLPRLPETARINLLFFDSEVLPYAGGLLPLVAEVQEGMSSYVLEHEPSGNTNLHGGLSLAFDHSDVQEIVLLTDGEPSVGEFVDPSAILAQAWRWNRWRGVRVSTVALKAPRRAGSFLERLAADHRGHHQRID